MVAIGAGGKAASELKRLDELREKDEDEELEEEDVAELERLAKAEESNKTKLRRLNDCKADGGARHAHPRPQRPPRLPTPSHGACASATHPPASPGHAPAPTPCACVHTTHAAPAQAIAQHAPRPPTHPHCVPRLAPLRAAHGP